MKNILITSFILILVSCSENSNYGQPNIEFKNLENNYMDWWVYYNNNIILSSDFVPIDVSSKKISKEVFLKSLTSGNFIPLKLKSKDITTNYYKLFKLDPSADEEIRRTIKNVSLKDHKHFKMEGKSFPDFNFTDLNGVIYSNEITKGKIVVLKCWFISCKPCIAEFPELNGLVKKYKNRNDIIFISLAFDSDVDLNFFLQEKPFEYAVVPNQEEFMRSILNIDTYPTHFVIDKTGKINKVVNKSNEMITEFENLVILTENLEKMVPPPPPK